MFDSIFGSRLGKCTFAVGALLLALYLAQNFGAERFGFTALLLYLPQHGWGLPPLLLLFWALRRRQFRLAFFNVALLLFWAKSLLGFQFFGPVARAENQNQKSATLRLMSYNIERGAGGTDALERAIRAQKPDILCLQESQGRFKGRDFAAGAQIAARLEGWNAAQSGDVMTLSRFPMIARRDYPLRGTRRILETTIKTPNGAVRVFNLHVSTSFAGQPFPPRDFLGRMIQIVTETKPAAQVRLQQIAPIKNALANSHRNDKTGPVLMAGDFNSPPRGLFFSAISGGFDDAWKRSGRGVGTTFPAHFPLLPIDHVLGRGVIFRRAFAPAVRASDHRPMIVDFNLDSRK